MPLCLQFPLAGASLRDFFFFLSQSLQSHRRCLLHGMENRATEACPLFLSLVVAVGDDFLCRTGRLGRLGMCRCFWCRCAQRHCRFSHHWLGHAHFDTHCVVSACLLAVRAIEAHCAPCKVLEAASLELTNAGRSRFGGSTSFADLAALLGYASCSLSRAFRMCLVACFQFFP